MAHPKVQAKLHEELDRVVGAGREPTVTEIQNLPYLMAVWKEALRWSPTTPLGLAHVCEDEDVFEGYTIPKKSWVFCNIG